MPQSLQASASLFLFRHWRSITGSGSESEYGLREVGGEWWIEAIFGRNTGG